MPPGARGLDPVSGWSLAIVLTVLSALFPPLTQSAAAVPPLSDSPSPDCLAAVSREVLPSDPPLLRPAPVPGQSSGANARGDAAFDQAAPTYSHLLATTALGRPRLQRWCVWIQPPSGSVDGALWETRWRSAVQRALAQWQTLLSIQLVDDASAAQVRLWRRRPPLATGPDGRRRASHGRATLTLERVRRGEVTRLEPAVEVLLSPSQRELAIEATALHELGHAFGLWGHSDDPRDAMAAVPGAEPVRSLSRRDRATIDWLYRQPTPFGQPLAP